ncbi:MAG: putative Fe-S cluster assembly protein SufT [Coxiella sp. (in: Bacteria)]|nr:MAG: putative Fe-S cluster assembly protein SufT [Coxiella sp. (in: g-proteobacteria)]
MDEREIIMIRRDCPALMVPSGAQIILHEGTEVTITQSLGGSYTVSVFGNLARIDARDADALGKDAISPLEGMAADATIEDKVMTMLHMVFDPEIPVNIVDLGLIYKVDVKKRDDDTFYVWVDMTLTAPGCGMGPTIAGDAKQRILMIPEVSDAHIEMVFDPPWDQSMMSEAAKLQLGML